MECYFKNLNYLLTNCPYGRQGLEFSVFTKTANSENYFPAEIVKDVVDCKLTKS